MSRLAAFALAFVLVASTGRAQDATDKQKAVAEANLKQGELKGYSVVASKTLILASPLPAARAQTVVDALEKTVATAKKGLQFTDGEEAWKGKLTIYHVPDRRAHAQFVRLVAGDAGAGGLLVAIRGDEPLVVTAVETGAKATDADIASDLGPAVGAAYFQSKAGSMTPVPPWVRDGYGRAASLRADAKRAAAYKTAAKTAVLGKGRPAATLMDLWGNSRPDGELLATAFLDYMAFGADKAGQDKFARFVSNLRPDENGDSPEVSKVIETAGWKAPELEAAWRMWVTKGMK